MPRTTLARDGSIVRELRQRGERERKSMGQVASELLAAALAESERPPSGRAFTWRSADLGVPSVDLEDKEAVRRALEEDR